MAGLYDGKIVEGGVVAIDSSGNTGLMLATMSAPLGLRSKVFLPKSTAPAKKDAINKAGGSYVEVEAADYDADTDLEACGVAVRKFCDSTQGAFYLDQFGPTPWSYDHDFSFGADYHQTIMDGAGSFADVNLACVGTSSSIMSTKRAAQKIGHTPKIVVVDQPGGQYARECGIEPVQNSTKRKVEGMNGAFVPTGMFRPNCDQVEVASADQSWDMVDYLKVEEGLDVGPTTGLVVHAAIELRNKMLAKGQSGLIAANIYDSGSLYR